MSPPSFLSRYEGQCKVLEVDVNRGLIEFLRKESGRSDELVLPGNHPALRKSRLNAQDIKAVLAAITNLTVFRIDVSYNGLSDEGAQHVASFMKQNSTVEILNISYNDISEAGVSAICNALQINSTLKSINFSGNELGNRGGLHVAGMLQVNATLEDVNLANTDLGTDSVIAMSTVLHQNSTVRYLNMNRPLLHSKQEETTVHIANMLKVNTGLREIHLQKHGIRDFGAQLLHENLKHNVSLTHLDISCNRISRDGAAQLAKLLERDPPLTHLDLGYNRIENEGVMAIAAALSNFNTTLKVLSVAGNSVRSKGLCALAASLRANVALEQVFVWGNEFDTATCVAFAELTEGEGSRLSSERGSDVQAYVVDGVTKLAQLTQTDSWVRIL